MRALHPDRGLAYLCQLPGKSRQAYYQGQQTKNNRLAFSEVVAELVVEVRDRVGNQGLGTRKLLPLVNEQLEKQSLSVGRGQLFLTMDGHGPKVRQRKRRKPRATDNAHGFKRYPNLTETLELERSEQLWASDITYVKVKDRSMCPSLITGAHPRKIMGYRLHGDLSVEGSMKALMMAVGNRQCPKRKLIHHSGQGVQYCAHNYVNMLKTNGIAISMASKGSPHENALAERINGILKQGYGLGKTIDTEGKARHLVGAAIEPYNVKRPHQSPDGQTPVQIHNADNWKQDLAEGLSIKSSTKKARVKATTD